MEGRTKRASFFSLSPHPGIHEREGNVGKERSGGEEEE